MFIERDQSPKCLRRQALGEQSIGRTIAFEYPVRCEPRWRSVSRDRLFALTECQRFGLRKQIRHQQIMMVPYGVQGLAEAYEVTWDKAGALMDELIEGVLAIGARFSPVDGPGFVVDSRAIQRHMLAVALHR